MNKHTLGPWTTKPEPMTGGTWEVLNSESLAVASVWPGELGADVVPANARLIAAAPDLLSALSGAVQWLGDLLAEEDPDGFVEAMQPLTDALVKATDIIHTPEDDIDWNGWLNEEVSS